MTSSCIGTASSRAGRIGALCLALLGCSGDPTGPYARAGMRAVITERTLVPIPPRAGSLDPNGGFGVIIEVEFVNASADDHCPWMRYGVDPMRTRVLDEGGERVDPSVVLAVGTPITVWGDPDVPVLASCPGQTSAGQVRLGH